MTTPVKSAPVKPAPVKTENPRTTEARLHKEAHAIARELGPCPPRGNERSLWHARAAMSRGNVLLALTHYAAIDDTNGACTADSAPAPDAEIQAAPEEKSFLEEVAACQ